jgi:hypothetical protein
MNKLKITTIAACIALFSNTAVLASGNTLDIDASIDSAITSSYKIKSIDISIKQAQNSYTSDIKKNRKLWRSIGTHLIWTSIQGFLLWKTLQISLEKISLMNINTLR